MNLLAIAQIIIGLCFFLYLPGYLLTRLFFRNISNFENILLSIMSSIMIGMSIGIFFGYDRAQALLTGGFTFENILIAEIIITLVLAVLLYGKREYDFVRRYNQARPNIHRKSLHIPKPTKRNK
jgi:uncharacterized membrane protein